MGALDASKYRVLRRDGRDGAGQKHDGCAYFVLDLTHDPIARQAARDYATAVRELDGSLAIELTDLADRLEPWDGLPACTYCDNRRFVSSDGIDGWPCPECTPPAPAAPDGDEPF